MNADRSQCHITHAVPTWRRDESGASPFDNCRVVCAGVCPSSLVRKSPATAALREKNRPQNANAKSVCFATVPLFWKLESFKKKKSSVPWTPTNIPIYCPPSVRIYDRTGVYYLASTHHSHRSVVYCQQAVVERLDSIGGLV